MPEGKMKKKILVMDDSALMRRVISDIINNDDRFTVAATASNGEDGLRLFKDSYDFDCALIDINMPKMNGIEFLEHMQQIKTNTKFIIVSSIASESTYETIRALELGAFDFVKKPDSFSGALNGDFPQNLINCVSVALGMKSVMKFNKKQELEVQPKVKMKTSKLNDFILIASSTGGPKSLQEVIPKLPGDLELPVVVIQHMPEGFTNSLALRLNEMSPLQVKETEDGEIMKKGYVYIAKGGYQLKLTQKTDKEIAFCVVKEPAFRGLRPCADVFLQSVIGTNVDGISCCVMTGMGDDATRGIKEFAEVKRINLIAQDEETSVVYGMPKAVKKTGLVKEIVPLKEIAETIIRQLP